MYDVRVGDSITVGLCQEIPKTLSFCDNHRWVYKTHQR